MRTSAIDLKGKRGDGRHGRRGLLLPLGLAGLAGAALTAVDTSCSLIVDTNPKQCTAATLTHDCGGFPGLRTCDGENVCAVMTTARGCTTNADCAVIANGVCAGGSCTRTCAAASDCGSAAVCNAGQCVAVGNCKVNADCASTGKYFICRKDNFTCTNLASQDCAVIAGDYLNDEAFIFGSVLPTGGPDMSTGQPIEQAIELAINDFKINANGIPPAIGATSNRPLAVVSCNDNSDTPTAERATHHLVDIGVQAIIGSAFSGITIDLATNITDHAGVLLFSPSATSATISTLPDDGLLWRTSPSDDEQTVALNLWLPDVAQAAFGTAPNALKIAILNKNDAYGSGLAQSLALALANPPNAIDTTASSQTYVQVNYGNPDDPSAGGPPNYAAAVSAALTLLPHIIFIFGANEGIHNVMEPIENQWPSSATYRPQYIFSDGGEVHDLKVYVAGLDDGGVPMMDIRTRITGSTPGSTGPVYKAFSSNFLNNYQGGSPATFGAAGAYDIVYMLAYSAAAISSTVGMPAMPLEARNLISGFSRVVTATTGKAVPFNIGPTNINKVFTTLSTNGSVQLTGASGPLGFPNTKGITGEAPSDILIWCLPTNADPVSSNYYYDPTTMPVRLTNTPVGLGSQCN